MTQTFALDEDQCAKLAEWAAKHQAKYTGAIGGRYTYSFHPTTIGVVAKVKDETSGEEIDLSDYENW